MGVTMSGSVANHLYQLNYPVTNSVPLMPGKLHLPLGHAVTVEQNHPSGFAGTRQYRLLAR